jgi:hypothetical protein
MPAKFYDPIEYADQAIDQQYRFQEGYRAANILDPIHETLTPEVWDDPGARLRPLPAAPPKTVCSNPNEKTQNFKELFFYSFLNSNSHPGRTQLLRIPPIDQGGH